MLHEIFHLLSMPPIAVLAIVRAIFLTHALSFDIELVLVFSLTEFTSAAFPSVRFLLTTELPFLQLIPREFSSFVPGFGECSARLQVQAYFVSFLISVFSVLPFELVPALLYLVYALIILFLIRKLICVDLASISVFLFIR